MHTSQLPSRAGHAPALLRDRPLPGPGRLLSVVVPVFNEAAGLLIFHRDLVACLLSLDMAFEVVYVDDGSSDRSRQILKQLRTSDRRLGLIGFSRNFGKEHALTAGLRAAQGDAVVLMDADGQHPAEAIAEMVRAWQEQGVDMVSMRRRSRQDEGAFKRLAARAFYRLINALSDVPVPTDVGDFRLLSRRAVDALNQLDERNRFMKGLYAWIGFSQTVLDYDVHERVAGHSKWRLRQLWRLAMDGLVSFSSVPLRLASYVGMGSALLSFAYAAFFLVKASWLGDPVAGFPTLIVTVLFLGGLQLMATGIVGEYLGRVFIEAKRRPLYVVDEQLAAAPQGGRLPNRGGAAVGRQA